MAKTSRGFRLGRKLVKVFKWCIRRSRTRRRATAYQRLEPPAGPISKIRKWVHSLRRRGGRGLCSGGSNNSGYAQMGSEPVDERAKLPKGYLMVYVGDDTCPVAVPVVYFNHPLFGELLREAEKVYGFDHPGGIQIPCPKSELESVQMRIAAASGGRIWPRRRR